MGNSFAADFQETLQVKYKMQCAWQPRYVHRCYQGNKIVDDSLCATIPKPTC